MGLRARRLELSDWRNARERSVGLSPSMTVLVGPNASGKTNAVEALQLLTAGTSFRAPSPAQLLREGAEHGRAAVRIEGDGRVLDVRCDVTAEKRRFTRNGKAVRPGEVAGQLLSVVFTPDDLDLVKRSASCRRRELDGFGSQASATFGKLVRSYARAVEQRNRLLKEPFPDRGLLDAWDASVASLGGMLLYHRLSLWEKLGALASQVYGELAPGDRLGVCYRASWGEPEPGMGRDDLEARLFQALTAARERDLARGQTTVGPHRDDPSFLLDGRSARDFGSQGQQRTVVLAWKLGQVRFCEERLGEAPMLLLDDVMSELDARRRRAVAASVARGIQTVVTTTHLGYFDQDVLAQAEVVSFSPDDGEGSDA